MQSPPWSPSCDPRVDEPPDPAPAPRPLESLKGSETILVVEDDEEVLALVRQVLHANGYAVLAAPSPEEALAISGPHPGPIPVLGSAVRGR